MRHTLTVVILAVVAARADIPAFAADHFEGEACREGNTDSPLIVKRHSDDDRGRAYVRVLGALTRKLFGSPLFGTVATTASVGQMRLMVRASSV